MSVLLFATFIFSLNVNFESIYNMMMMKLFILIQVYVLVSTKNGWKEGNALFHDTLNTFFWQLYGIGHILW